MQTFDALLCYRKSAQSSFVLRHNAVNDESMLLANMATGQCGSLSSFTVVEGLGKGSFGAVFLVEHHLKLTKKKGEDDGKDKKKETALLAVKMVARETVSSSEKRIRHLEIERRVMAQIKGHPFVITLHYALQSPAALFFVMDFCAGGDLFYHLCQRRHKPQANGMKHFSEEEVKFFSAQVVSALGHLHDNFIVYRYKQAHTYTSFV
jgi:serine/threonine protein kinase